MHADDLGDSDKWHGITSYDTTCNYAAKKLTSMPITYAWPV